MGGFSMGVRYGGFNMGRGLEWGAWYGVLIWDGAWNGEPGKGGLIWGGLEWGAWGCKERSKPCYSDP